MPCCLETKFFVKNAYYITLNFIIFLCIKQDFFPCKSGKKQTKNPGFFMGKTINFYAFFKG